MQKQKQSPINRLLTEVFWAPGKVKQFKEGGHADEDVLTTHVLRALDLLPRTTFLAAVLRAAGGEATEALRIAAADVEDAELTVLPNDPFLHSPAKREFPRVQPDGILNSPSAYAWFEAKRIQGGSFQPDQLAREYFSVTKAAEGRSPLLLLLIGAPPPVAVKQLGAVEVVDAVAHGLGGIYEKCGGHPEPLDELTERIPERVAWITWAGVSGILEQELSRLDVPPSLQSSLRRTVDLARGAIERQLQALG